MSNEYENQLARERQEKKDHQRNLEQAAQRAAQAAERARQEQNASLQRQEALIETNNFRNTVLSALPLVQKDQQKQYILNQIRGRITNIKPDGLYIQKFEFLKSIGMDTIVETEGLKIENQDCFKLMMKSANELKTNLFPNDNLTQVLQYAKKHFSDKEKSVKSAILHKKIAVVLLVLIHLLLIVILITHYERAPLEPVTAGGAITMYLMFTCIPWVYLVNRAKNINKVKKNINDEEMLFEKRSEVKSMFMSLMQVQINIIRQNELSVILGMVFDYTVKNKINDEQSFIPPNILPSYDDWKENIFTQKTISNINIYLSDLEKDINEYAFIMGQEMLSIGQYKSHFYIAHGRIPQ